MLGVTAQQQYYQGHMNNTNRTRLIQWKHMIAWGYTLVIELKLQSLCMGQAHNLDFFNIYTLKNEERNGK